MVQPGIATATKGSADKVGQVGSKTDNYDSSIKNDGNNKNFQGEESGKRLQFEGVDNGPFRGRFSRELKTGDYYLNSELVGVNDKTGDVFMRPISETKSGRMILDEIRRLKIECNGQLRYQELQKVLDWTEEQVPDTFESKVIEDYQSTEKLLNLELSYYFRVKLKGSDERGLYCNKISMQKRLEMLYEQSPTTETPESEIYNMAKDLRVQVLRVDDPYIKCALEVFDADINKGDEAGIFLVCEVVRQVLRVKLANYVTQLMLKEFSGLVTATDSKSIRTIMTELQHALEQSVDHGLDCANNRLMGVGFSSLQEYPVSEWFTPETRPTRVSAVVENLKRAVRNYEKDHKQNTEMFPDSLMMNVLYTQHLAAYHLCLSMNEVYQPELKEFREKFEKTKSTATFYREFHPKYRKFCEEGNLPENYPNPYIAFLKELTKIFEKKESEGFEALRDYPSPYYDVPDTVSAGIVVRNDAQVRQDSTNGEYVVCKKLHVGSSLPVGPRALMVEKRPAAEVRPKSENESTKKVNNIQYVSAVFQVKIDEQKSEKKPFSEVYGDLPTDMAKWTEEQMFDGFEKLLDAFPVDKFLMPLFKPQVDFLVRMHGKDYAEIDEVRKILKRGEFTVTSRAGSCWNICHGTIVYFNIIP